MGGSNIIADLLVRVNADTSEMESKLAGAKASMNGFIGSMRVVGAGMTAAITLPLIGVGVAAFQAARDYDAALDIISVATGATGDTLTELGESARAVFTQIPTDMATAATAIGELDTRTAQTGEGLELLAMQFIELSRLSGTDLNTNIREVTRAFGDWGVATADQSATMDYFFQISQATGIGVDTLASKLVQFGAPLRSMGFDLETSAALLGKFEAEGVNTELVLGSMRIALGKMAKEGVTDTNAALVLLVDEIKNAGSSGEAAALAMEVFGARAGPDMAAAIREGRFEVGDLMAALGESETTILGTAAATNDFAEKWQIAKNQIIDLLIPLGMLLFDALNGLIPLIQTAVGHIQTFATWFQNLSPQVQKAAGIVAIFLAALGPIMVILGPIIAGLSALISVVGLVAGAFTALGAVLLANPIVLIIGGIVAAIALLYYAYQNNLLGFRDGVQAVMGYVAGALESAKGVWNTFSSAVSSAVSAVSGAVSSGFSAITGVLSSLRDSWNNLSSGVQLAISALLGPIVLLYTIWQQNLFGIRDVVSNVFSAIAGALTNAGSTWAAFKDAVSGVVASVRDAISGAFSAIAGALSSAQATWSGFTASVGATISGFKDSAIAAFTTMKDTLSSSTTLLRDALGATWATIRDTVVSTATGLRDSVVSTFNSFRDSVTSTVSGMKDSVVSAISSLRDSVTTTIGNLRDTAVSTVDNLRDTAVSRFNAMKDTIVSTINGLKDSAIAAFNSFRDLATSAVETLRSSVVSKVTDLKTSAVSIIVGLKDGAVQAFNDLLAAAIAQFSVIKDNVVAQVTSAKDSAISGFTDLASGVIDIVSDIPGDIVAALTGLGGLLVDAGKEIIGGFVQGIEDAMPSVGGVLEGLTDKIPDWKGPPVRDEKLLVGSGALIMEGLGEGLTQGYRDIQRMLSQFTGDIAGVGYGSVIPSYATGSGTPLPSAPIQTIQNVTIYALRADEYAELLAEAQAGGAMARQFGAAMEYQ